MVEEATGTDRGNGVAPHGAARLMEMISGYWTTQILRATAELSLADHVAAGVTTAEGIAGLEDSDPQATFRLLRAAASLGLFADAGEGRFRLTETGTLLRKDVPGSFRDMAVLQGSPLHWQSWGLLPEVVRRGAAPARAALGLAEGETEADYLARHTGEAAHFATARSNLADIAASAVAEVLDLGRVSVAVELGGMGESLGPALTRRDARLIGLVSADFLHEVPAADLYLLKVILHGRDDADCVGILANCRASARRGARAAVVESVVGRIGEPGFGALQDVNMLAVSQGRERDLGAFDALYAASGWRRVSVKGTGTPYVIQELVAV
ncbi:methyltransferase [Streptomyces tendae]|uniref:methyltransferase n=1 Tax=Streptomyces tendae TaxID=1932 RepID=UPI00378738CE